MASPLGLRSARRIVGSLAVVLLTLWCGGSAREGAGLASGRSAASGALHLQLALERIVVGNPTRRDIVLVRADGRTIRTLVRSRPGLFFAGGSWSPDGRRFAYAAVRDSPRGRDRVDVFVVGANGSEAHRLTASGRAIAPVWSPDGRHIAFTQLSGRGRSASGSLWMVELIGGKPRRLLDDANGRLDLASSFSPDGSRLAFTRSLQTRPTRTALVLDLRTGRLGKLADGAADPAFAPDGKAIAYVGDRDRELYVADGLAGIRRRLTRTRNLDERVPSWSPDGRLIAFERGLASGNAQATIAVTVRADGSCPRPLGFDPRPGVSYANPVWRPGRQTGDADLQCRPIQSPRPSWVTASGKLTLAQARRFEPFTVYWLGRRWEGLPASPISARPVAGPRGSGPVVNVHYGTLTIQHWPACILIPADVHGRRDKTMRLRGVEAAFVDGGHRLELVTGKATIVIFGGRRRILRAARRLVPIGATATDTTLQLPPPAPGALARSLRC